MKLKSLIILIGFFLQLSCTKFNANNTEDIQILNETEKLEIADWINESILKSTQLNKTSLQNLKNIIHFDFGKKEKLDDRTNIIYFPIDNNSNGISITKKTFVLFFKKENKISSAEILELIAEKKTDTLKVKTLIPFYKKIESQFNGTAIFSTINYRKFCSYTYINNKRAIEKYVGRIKKSQTITSNSNKQINSGTNCTDWYWEYYENGIWVGEEYAYTTCEDLCSLTTIAKGGVTETIRKPNCGSIDNSNPSSQEIVDSIKNLCISSVWQKLSSLNLKNDILSSMNLLFGQSVYFNLKIHDVTDLRDPSDPSSILDGYTQRFPILSNTINLDVSLNLGILAHSSKEYIAATIIHEIMHANLIATQQAGLVEQHEYMLTNYVEEVEKILLKNFPTIDPFLAKSLSYMGLTKEPSFTNGNKWTEIEKQNIKNNLWDAKIGALGDICN